MPAPPGPASFPRQTYVDAREAGPGVGRRVLNLLGHVLAAALGLFVSYLILKYWFQIDLSQWLHPPR